MNTQRMEKITVENHKNKIAVSQLAGPAVAEF